MQLFNCLLCFQAVVNKKHEPEVNEKITALRIRHAISLIIVNKALWHGVSVLLFFTDAVFR